VEALADAVGLRAFCFCPGLVNAFQVKIQRVFVLLAVAAVLAAAVSQDAQQRVTGERLGLANLPIHKSSPYGAFQAIGLELFKRFGDLAHGLSWASFHRHQPGQVYAYGITGKPPWD
jgi:hypothetical protein